MKYTHIFFDLDHTLWDFEKNAAETLRELYDNYNLLNKGVASPEVFVDKYREVNLRFWELYRNGKITKKFLREERFVVSLTEIGVDKSQIPSNIWEDYLSICPFKTNLMPHAFETLSYLSGKYPLFIISNGFEEIQKIKLNHSGIKEFFTGVFTSEATGHQKPSKVIFEHALRIGQARAKESIMIGDSFEMDIVGAKNAGLDQVWFNPDKLSKNDPVTYEISSLKELKGIL